MGANAPVGVGLPIYNGEDFLGAAIDSLLAQTYKDFEIIISDNASTDSSEQLVKQYASRDSRIKYFRAPENRGIIWNYNEVFKLSSNPYFMWFAHDDLLAPTYIERCLEVLENDPSVVLCFSRWRDIDGSGQFLDRLRPPVHLDSPDPVRRFFEAIPPSHSCETWCGMIRSEVIRKMPPMGSFADYDRVWLAELSLHGRFIQIDKPLFFHREHMQRPIHARPDAQKRTSWLDPRNRSKIVFPNFRMLWEYFAAATRAPLSFRQRIGCYWTLLKWVKSYGRGLLKDIKAASTEIMRRILAPRTQTSP